MHIGRRENSGSPRRAVRRVLTRALACVALAGAAAAQPEEPKLVYEGAIVVNDGATLRQQPATIALVEMLREARVLPPIERAWTELSGTMGLEGAAAFDRLLGRRVAVFFEQQQGGSSDWAIASQVDAATEQLVRERLRPAPRGFVAGAPVLTLENGAFELAVPRETSGAGLPTLVLGPRDGAMLDRLIPKGAAPPAPPQRVGSARDVRGDLFAVYRRPGSGAIPEFAAATAWAQGSRWRVAYSGTRTLLASGMNDDGFTPALPLVSPASWAAMSDGAALAVLAQNKPEIAGVGAVTTIWQQLLGDGPTPERAGSSVAVMVEEPAAGAGWVLAFATPVVLDPASASHASASHASGASDERATSSAIRGDQAMVRVLRAIGSPDFKAPDFGGKFPGAIRVASAPGETDKAAAPRDHNRSLLSRSSWAWTYAVTPAGDRAWWIISICGPGASRESCEVGATRAASHLRNALCGEPGRSEPNTPAHQSPVADVSRFVARPDAIARGLVELGLPDLGLVAALRQAERLEWRCSPGAPGLVEGEITLDLRSAAQK